MHTKQTIAIMGATGSMGAAIAKSLAKGNYRLLLFAEDQQLLAELHHEIKTLMPAADTTTIPCSFTACWEADIIISAVAPGTEKDLANKIRTVANQKIVISISNGINDEFDETKDEPLWSAAEELQSLLPHSKVVKAFNTMFADDFSQPVIDGKRADAFIAGNDKEALETVADLVRTSGFNPVIAGGLRVSRTLENMQSLLIRLSIQNNYNWPAGWKILHNEPSILHN